MSETPTNPGGGEDTSADTLDPEPEVETPLVELDDNGDPIEREPEPEPEDEEVEIGSAKVRVPRAQAEEVRKGVLMHADYTRKTMELAEVRKAALAEREAVAQATTAEINALATVRSLDAQLTEYGKVDWDAYFDENPIEAQKAYVRFQQAQNARGQAAEQLGQLQQQRQGETQRQRATRIAEAAAKLADPKEGIQGWSPQYAATLLDSGTREYGFERSEIEDFEDARMVRVLDDAVKWRQHQAQQKKAQGHAAAGAVKPAARVGGAAPDNPQGNIDRLRAEAERTGDYTKVLAARRRAGAK